MKNRLLFLFLIMSLLGCGERSEQRFDPYEFQNIPLKYAHGFSIKQASGFYVIEILKPYKGAEDTIRYVFYEKQTEKPAIEADAYVQVPIETIVTTSTTHIPLLDYLQETDKLIGFPTLDYISSELMRERIDSGLVRELGVNEALNLEALIELGPDAVMAYSLHGDLGQFAMIREAGIPVIINAEYLEGHPLGRAEWIKLAGLLFSKQKQADSVFNYIERQYLETKHLLLEDESAPSALSGIVYGDSWYLPGGKNYASTLLRDAGFKFFWEEDTTSAFLPVSFEVVFDRAQGAEFWIGVASFRTLDEIKAADNRYTRFSAYNKQQVFSYNKRIGAKGGSEFLELGYLRPDIILKDLVKIGHPDLLPEHDLFFHFKLP
jgi:iron complex transport system substrate-binding protein